MKSQDIEGIIFTVLVYVGIPTLLIIATWWARRRRALLRQGGNLITLAERLEGRVERHPSLEVPFVRFAIEGIPCYYLAWAVGPDSPSMLVLSAVEVRLGAEGYFEASSSRSNRHPTRYPRGREISGPGGFRVVTTDGTWAVGLLARGMERLLIDLARANLGPVRVQIAPGRIRLEIERHLGPEAAVELVRGARRLIGLIAPRADGAGIRVVGLLFDPKSGRCPVCWARLEGAPFLCEKCRVPHHLDCWSYLGRCGIFGCGGRRSA